MARTRGEANQALFRARILLDAWAREREAGSRSDERLTEAFLPAVRLHLGQSYGWFLLAVSGAEQAESDAIPRTVSDLPEPPAGKQRAPELAEFAQLEQRGWLADMLADDEAGSPEGASGSSANLLGSDRQAPGQAVAEAWQHSLASIMARMDDSLQEC